MKEINSSLLKQLLYHEEEHKWIIIPPYLALWFDHKNRLSVIDLVDDVHLLPFVSISINFDLNKYSINEPDFNEVKSLTKIAPLYEKIFDSLEFTLYDDTIQIWHVYKPNFDNYRNIFVQFINESFDTVIRISDAMMEVSYDISKENPFDLTFDILRMFTIHIKI